ncbi:MAG TPA: glycine cleavage system aminomethyltransferase GcvT [Actinomycetota bacterium]|nr:glycine cleavage system aminomethyltransferase GcvT [Actinomycetota bacterium]
MSARATPLLAAHAALDARLTEFAGWQMPLQYSGVIAEHNAVRTAAGLFDVTHLGKLRVRGPHAGDALQRALTADVVGLEPGRATYALALVDDGGCVDDVFVYRIGAEEWLVVPNAANVEAVAECIRSSGAEPVDEWDRYAILALQGPDSFTVFEKVWPGAEALSLSLHHWCTLDVFGSEGLVARTGYTGERGFEIYAPFEVAERAWTALLDAGATPVGLGARDTLRLEMGYALYGHELTREINPLEAGLGWALAWDTPFRGREALLAVKEGGGPKRRLFGIVCADKGVPRQGYPVFRDDAPVGELTSGNFSPTLGTGIALALGPTATRPEPGERVAIEARGRRIPGDIVKPPFKQS